MDGLLVLSNGRILRGRLRGARKPTSGEVIFNTAMTGYQEILTDPSYAGQIVVMTYPHIGNYGANAEDVEARQPFAAGMVVKELSPIASSWRAGEDLEAYLERNGITVLEGVDTRALVVGLREQGAVPGLIVPAEAVDEEKLRAEAAALPGMEGQNLAERVSVSEPFAWPGGAEGLADAERTAPPPGEARWRVLAYDYGIKYNILRELARRGIAVEVVPYDFPAEKVLERAPDGIFLSNGPGDPEPVLPAVRHVRSLLGRVPVFGICLGHQILGLALGARSYKLKFGHHGANHPVQDLATGAVAITSQNHGFALREDSLPASVEVTHRSLYDRTVEGIASLEYPAYSVQYHPEASPGPHDSGYLFDRFVELMERHRQQSA